ncbi:hypothetical protein L3V83_04945 [Thiotrichales bacterium 19X7-9]|nr:hypothetical protein [Thiotrichales bacterium 19X7-9]
MPRTQEMQRVVDLFEKGLAFSLLVDKQYWFGYEEYGFLGYAKRETNSVTAGLNALEYAFTENWDDQSISLDLITSIHQKVTEDVNPYPLHSAQLRHKKLDDNEVNHIKQGIRITPVYFEINACEPTCESDLEVDIESIQTNKAKLICTKANQLEQKLEAADSKKSYNKLCYQYYSDAKEYDFKLGRSKPGYSYYVIPPLTKEDILANLYIIIDNYNTKLPLCQSDTERLELIFKTVKGVELTHPFYDANLRTSVILLQRLLVQNGFMPTAFIDPNRIDNVSVNNLIKYYQGRDGILAIERLLKSHENRVEIEDAYEDSQPFFQDKVESQARDIIQDNWGDSFEEVYHLGGQVNNYYKRSAEIATKINNAHSEDHKDTVISSIGHTDIPETPFMLVQQQQSHQQASTSNTTSLSTYG